VKKNDFGDFSGFLNPVDMGRTRSMFKVVSYVLALNIGAKGQGHRSRRGGVGSGWEDHVQKQERERKNGACCMKRRRVWR